MPRSLPDRLCCDAVRRIDLRSDTVTRPSAAMREAMASAEVGDDVFGEDPTVNRLQERVAGLLGKEAALFVPSGTMGNQAALRLLTRPGDVVLAGEACHVLEAESAAAAALSGLHIRPIGHGGFFEPDEVRAAATGDADPHVAPSRVLAVENTHNAAGGRIFPFEQLGAVAEAARERGLLLHLDGARLWNAAVASGIPLADWARPFDTVSVCLSKGLGAPAGSLVCAPRARLRELVRIRKMLGGGMRQAGILAAAGLHALDHHVKRLAEDHAHARRLAEGLAALGLDVAPPETNLVFFRAAERGLVEAAARRGVWMLPFSAGRIRAVTHLDVSAADVEEALGRIAEALAECRAAGSGARR
jgi:threonine aldolase